jgi:hypothetical protein
VAVTRIVTTHYRYKRPSAKRKAQLLVALIGLAFTLTACTAGWIKTGATYDDYLQDRYKCILDARAQVSGFTVDAYGGSGSSRPAVSNSIFQPCMASKGWIRDDQNGFKPPPGGAVHMVR